MPILPENRARYPANWPEIRASILERAQNRCEVCGLDNYAVIRRKADGSVQSFGIGADYREACEIAADEHWAQFGDELPLKSLGIVIVVLTVAHLDHTPEHCEPSNLKAMCQKCHLAYDAEHHGQTAYATRRRGFALGDLFA